MLARENKRRAAGPRDDSFDNVLVRIDEDGIHTEVKISKVRVRSQWGDLKFDMIV